MVVVDRGGGGGGRSRGAGGGCCCCPLSSSRRKVVVVVRPCATRGPARGLRHLIPPPATAKQQDGDALGDATMTERYPLTMASGATQQWDDVNRQRQPQEDADNNNDGNDGNGDNDNDNVKPRRQLGWRRGPCCNW
ncbi:hypothetical protein EDB89DRAFT_1911759 [Lactarius sanguifluus]|nr:hypothetical protein EDB89DRAFT_1911759 [Lactarius sanguifluus]